MFIRKTLLMTAIFSAIAVFSAPQNAAAENFSVAQKEEMGAIIKDYLMNNPEVIIEAVNEYRENEEKRADSKAKDIIKSKMDMMTAEGMPSVGNKDADITVIEFFDYNCGYCKRAIGDIQSIVNADKNVRFVFMEMPILGPASFTASQWAMAAHQQGKYFEYHAALMNHPGGKDEKTLEKLAKNVGLDIDKMKEDANSEEVASAIKKSSLLAQEIGIRGTPAFIVGQELFRGYIGREGLKQAIQDQRENQG